MPFFTVYLFGTGWSVWPRSVKGNFSWKNSSKLNKVINEETAFKLVTAWEESYDVITRQLSIRQYTFMKKCRYSIGKQQGAEYILSFQAVKVHLLKTFIEELLKK